MLIYMGSGAALARSLRNRRMQDLVECSQVCGRAYRHCLDRVGPEPTAFAEVAIAAISCQELCALAASLMSRGSKLAHLAFSGCAEACRRCAEACERDDVDEIVRECGLRCRDCERSCRTLAELEGPGDRDPYISRNG